MGKKQRHLANFRAVERKRKRTSGEKGKSVRCRHALEEVLSYFQSEDWLIVITTDHGGIETWHGGQTLEERSTWIVCNKPIDEKYMGSGYDGYTEK